MGQLNHIKISYATSLARLVGEMYPPLKQNLPISRLPLLNGKPNEEEISSHIVGRLWYSWLAVLKTQDFGHIAELRSHYT